VGSHGVHAVQAELKRLRAMEARIPDPDPRPPPKRLQWQARMAEMENSLKFLKEGAKFTWLNIMKAHLNTHH
jgi:hypothetical protein